MKQLAVKQLMLKFKTVHYLGKKGRPFTDYETICELDEAKGLNIGTQYRNDKAAATFSHYIAEAEREIIRQEI
jgi:hypothetical protein